MVAANCDLGAIGAVFLGQTLQMTLVWVTLWGSQRDIVVLDDVKGVGAFDMLTGAVRFGPNPLAEAAKSVEV